MIKETLFAFRYGRNLDGAKNVAVRKGLIFGIGTGIMHIAMFPAFGLAYWYATTLGYSGGDTMNVLLNDNYLDTNLQFVRL